MIPSTQVSIICEYNITINNNNNILYIYVYKIIITNDLLVTFF